MARTFKDQVARLNDDLKRDLATMQVRERITFHRATDAHGKAGKRKNRHDRRSTRAALKRGGWD